MRDVLLSRPVLLTLGSDLDAHLARVRTQYHDKDMSHVSFDAESRLGGELARLLRSSCTAADNVTTFMWKDDGVCSSSYATASATPDESDRHMYDMNLDVGVHSAADVTPYLETMLRNTAENGLPAEL